MTNANARIGSVDVRAYGLAEALVGSGVGMGCAAGFSLELLWLGSDKAAVKWHS